MAIEPRKNPFLYPNGYNSPKEKKPKALFWLASAKKDLMSMPADVIDVFGYALHLAQTGSKHAQAKSLEGFHGAGVLEVVEDHLGDTYRAVYTINIGEAVYVLHCFKKKSTKGSQTPKPDMDLIRNRIKAAQAHAKGT
jgi:phage-related protein